MRSNPETTKHFYGTLSEFEGLIPSGLTVEAYKQLAEAAKLKKTEASETQDPTVADDNALADSEEISSE